jgi:hypothetical protein
MSSIKFLKEAEKQRNDLDALITLVTALSQTLTQLEERIKVLENGPRQRQTNRSNRGGEN